MSICQFYANELSKRASVGTQHRFFKRYSVVEFVEKLFNTAFALGEIKPEHELTIGNQSFKRSDYSLPESLNLAVWNNRIYMSKDDAGRCKPVLEATNKYDPDKGLLTPDEIIWFVNDFNDKQAESQFKIKVVSTSTDCSFAFQDLRDVAIGGRTYKFSGSVDVENLSQFLCYDSPVTWTNLVPDFVSVGDEEVVSWILNA